MKVVSTESFVKKVTQVFTIKIRKNTVTNLFLYSKFSLKKADLDVLIFDIKGHVKIFSLLHVTFDIKEWKKSFKPSKF